MRQKTLQRKAPLQIGLGLVLPHIAVGLSLLLWGTDADAQSLTLDLGSRAAGGDGSGSTTTAMVSLFLAVTLLSVAPGLLVMVTAFTRIVVVLSLLRTAIGLQQAPPNSVIVSLALFLTAFVMAPYAEKAWNEAARPYMGGIISEEVAAERAIAPFRAFMEANTRDKDIALFMELAGQTGVSGKAVTPAQRAQLPLRVLVPAFMTSELSKAFQIGFLLFLPFLVIDIAIAAILMGMGMMMLPPIVVSLPFKLIFFILVDGWQLVAGSLVRSFTQ